MADGLGDRAHLNFKHTRLWFQVCTRHNMDSKALFASTLLVFFVWFHIEVIAQEVSENVYRPYAFAYESNDGLGTTQHRKESGNERGSVKGSYGFMDPYGTYRAVDYIADNLGFRAVVKTNEAGTANQNPADTVWLVQPPPDASSPASGNQRLLKKTSAPVQTTSVNFTPLASPSRLAAVSYPSHTRHGSSHLTVQNQYPAPEYTPPVRVAPYYNDNTRFQDYPARESRFYTRSSSDYYKK